MLPEDPLTSFYEHENEVCKSLNKEQIAKNGQKEAEKGLKCQKNQIDQIIIFINGNMRKSKISIYDSTFFLFISDEVDYKFPLKIFSTHTNHYSILKLIPSKNHSTGY